MLWFDGQKYDRDGLKGAEVTVKETPVLQQAVRWLDDYFAGRMPAVMTLPLRRKAMSSAAACGASSVRFLTGRRRTYGESAKAVESQTGKKMSPQAVGGAVGHNPISIIIPCHRVLGAGGKATGYAGGIDKNSPPSLGGLGR